MCQRNIRTALRISNFYVPAFVPTNLASQQPGGELSKPILFDCDYEYSRDEDSRLAVKWFKNKEPEPFYQWLPELNARHFADWIRPLVNASFVTDPHDPLKRYRSLAIKRLSFNLTGSYSCAVSSLAGHDMHEAPLVVYAPPRSFTFEHRLFPAPPAAVLRTQAPPAAPVIPPPLQPAPPYLQLQQQQQQQRTAQERDEPAERQSLVGPSLEQRQALAPGRPTQFRGLGTQPALLSPVQSSTLQQQLGAADQSAPPAAPGIVLVRPPNNQHHLDQSVPGSLAPLGLGDQPPAGRIVYTHDGRPIRRKTRQAPIAQWQLKQRLGGATAGAALQPDQLQPRQHRHVLQLHHFQCHATQVYPRPVLVLTVKRQADSIAQYLHESSSVTVRPYQLSAHELLAAPSTSGSARAQQQQQQSLGPATAMVLQQQQLAAGAGHEWPAMLKVFDITVSATVALNVSLPATATATTTTTATTTSDEHERMQSNQMGAWPVTYQTAGGINTVLQYRHGQRMSFECHLEITGTDYGRREQININETEVFQWAEMDETRRRQRVEAQQRQQQQRSSSGLLADLVGSSATALANPTLPTMVALLSTVQRLAAISWQQR